MPEFPPPKVLIVDNQANLRSLAATRIQEKYGYNVVQANSPAEAINATRDQEFEIIFFGHPAWEQGVLLYVDILNSRKHPCQFLLFMEDPSEVGTCFEDYLTVVAKPDWEGLLAAADWPPLHT